MFVTRLRAFARASTVTAMVATTPALAAEPPICGGTNLIAKAQAESPDKYAAFERDGLGVPNAEGLLWRVEGKGAPASHLFGTMHTTDSDLVALAAPVREALAGSKSVAVEVADAAGAAVQAETVAFITKNALDFSGKGLDGLSEQQAAEVKRRIGEAGMPASAVAALKPWFLAMTLQVAACEIKRMGVGLPTVDAAVEAVGRQAGAKVIGLETVAEQLDAVARIPEDTARRMIRDAVARPRVDEDMQATTLALYRARRVGWYYAMKRETFGDAFDASSYPEFMADIVDRRNRLMAERAKPLLAEGGAFIAVGALHLPGEKGVIELLREQGFEVTKVW